MNRLLLKIAAVAVQGFFRAGRHWPHEGVIMPVADLTEGDLKRIRAEPNLHVEEVDGDRPDLSDDDLRAALMAAITALSDDSFGQDGKPKLEPLRAALPDQADRITAKLRDEIWAGLRPAS